VLVRWSRKGQAAIVDEQKLQFVVYLRPQRIWLCFGKKMSNMGCIFD